MNETNNVHVRITTENAAFKDDLCTEEVARILRGLADAIERTGTTAHCFTLRDVNGNKVGEYTYDEEV